MNSDDSQVRSNLKAQAIHAMRLLASDAPVQISAFPSFVDVPSELARAVSDVLDMLSVAEYEDVLVSAEMAALEELRGMLRQVFSTRNPNLITSDALASSESWTRIRQRAGTLMATLKWSGPPGPSQSTFVPGS